MAYIPVPIETAPVDLSADAFDYLTTSIQGWQPSPANLESILIEGLSQLAGELRVLIALVPESIFMYFGATVLGIPPYPAIEATVLTTWTAVDAQGYTVDAGTVIAITPPASLGSFGFQVVETFQIPAGQTSVSGVECRALEAGAAANGITGTVTVIDPLVFIREVTLDRPVSGGSDAESAADYLARLSRLLTLLSPRPILPRDFATLVQARIPGVARAVAIDLLNAQTGETNVPRCVTVVIVGTDGRPVAEELRQEAEDLLRSEREVNFLSFVVNGGTYSQVDVSAQVRTFAGWNPTEVAARVEQALRDYLSPAGWGVPPVGDPGLVESWLNVTVVRYLEVAAVIDRVDGVDYITFLELGFHGGLMGQADIALPGIAPMPEAGTITVTAVPERA